jgi:HK97 family phage major capsid protein/HK97 family phage prohead protease
VNRAYSLLHVKAVDSERRIITGIATTPEPDRMGDIVEPKGVKYTNPLPLLLHHDKTQPVGRVTFKTPTSKGVEFEASLPFIDTPGIVRDRVNEAWDSVKAGLIAGVSVGFRVLDDAVEQLKDGGLRFLKTEVMELSLVTIPANAGATILTIKSIDALDLAATGHHSPGVTGTLPVVSAVKAARPMNTVAEQITSFENTRASKVAEMNAIMTKASEVGTTLDAEQTEKYDTLASELKSIDAHLPRLRDLEKSNAIGAVRITGTTEIEKASELRGSNNVIRVQSMLPKGTAFTRYVMAIAAGGGDSFKTMEYAKQWNSTTPEVELMVKAAVAAGTTTDATWAGPLVVSQPLINEFLELLRPRTLLGRIPGLKQVPFNVTVPTQTTGGTYGWVGQNKPKPVTKADYATVTLTFAKAAGIIVLSEELVRLSTPSAEGLVREEMIAGMGAFLDTQFVDPAIAAVANVNPASITNGAATIASSGVTAAAAKIDLASRVAVFVAANIPVSESVWLMNEANAFGIGLSLNALGQPLFPGFNGDSTGGRLLGIPVVVSNNVGARIVLVHTPSILYADEGGVRVDVSREASVQMDSAPTDTVDATTVYLSLWQRNLIGLKAERFITWVRARTAAVTYITTASPYIGT